jgi:DsbC/DsbD-like thiol-disulfide interchange protein
MFRTALLLSLVISFGAQAAPPTDLVKAELLANTNAIQPGKPFTLGVMMKIEPGWHTYWKNPGDSGAPTKITFTAPEGFTVDPIQFPTPIEFDQPGDIVGFGYTNEVMLTARVTPPANLKAGDSINIKANASWLCCEAVCIPGKQALSITLPVAIEASAANKELFDKWLAMVPTEKGFQAQPKTSGDGKLESAQITVAIPTDAKDVHLFTAPPRGVKVENAEVKSNGKTATATFTSRALAGAKPATQPIEVVVGYTDESGRRRGIAGTIPVQSSKTSNVN